MAFNFSNIDRNTLIGRALRWPLSLIPATSRLPILQGALRRQRWIVGSSNHGCWLGSYELDQQVLISQLVKEGDVVFDVGAHVGFYTLLSSLLVGKTGRVVAFEPIPENLTYLKQHLEINSINNVDVIEAAVSDCQGHVRMSRGPASSMWHLDAQGESEVSTVSLDDLVLTDELPPPNLVKMDIEGGEVLALNGSAELINRFHPVLILSTHGYETHQRCLRFLDSASYCLSPIGRASIDECRELLAVYGGTT